MILEATVIKEGGGMGRIDLLRPSTGEAWEIKPSTRRSYYGAGVVQLRRYVNGRLVTPIGRAMRVGGGLSGNTFVYPDGQRSIRVQYWYAGQGIILYSYEYLQKQEPGKSTPRTPSYAFDRTQPNSDANTRYSSRPEIVPFPTRNEGIDDDLAAATVFCVAAIFIIGASCLTGVPFWAVLAI